MNERDTNTLKTLIIKYGYCGLELEIIHLRDTVMFNPQLDREE